MRDQKKPQRGERNIILCFTSRNHFLRRYNSPMQHSPWRQQRKRTNRQISNHSENDNHHKQSPNLPRRERRLRQPSSSQPYQRFRHQSVTQERKQHHCKRIHRPGLHQVPMQQGVKRPQRSASRAVPSGQIVNRTRWKDPTRRRIKHTQQKHSHSGGQHCRSDSIFRRQKHGSIDEDCEAHPQTPGESRSALKRAQSRTKPSTISLRCSMPPEHRRNRLSPAFR